MLVRFVFRIIISTVRLFDWKLVTITAVMSSSDEDVGDDKYLDRALFVKLVTQHPVIIEKSKTPSAVKAKKDAWKIVSEDYSSATGKVVTVVQLNKLLSNMKSNIKIKTDKKQTGNKPIKMKSWETEFHDFLSQGNNPVFSKVPGSISIGTSSNPTTSATKTLAEVEQSDDENLSNEGTVCGGKKTVTKVRKSAKTVMAYESDETKDLSIPQLQRIVLLQQMQLNKLKLKREKINLKMRRKVLLKMLLLKLIMKIFMFT
ncbi:hypothetical protein J6590_018894 [Homalodisca vitripennis]|nr:hypothetical protein J6590_018894 [Homalodisca vitripennis]